MIPPWAKSICVVVAHPDDETLWAGGLLLTHADRRWFVISLCRGSDRDRAPKFHRVLGELRAAGAIADMDDGPEQTPLSPEQVEQTILDLFPSTAPDLILTHGPRGEYTRHRRHEETCRALVSLWRRGRVQSRELWMFAFEDGNRAYLPRADAAAPLRFELPEEVWSDKRRLITEVYGFSPESWEARVTPRTEAFWRFRTPDDAARYLEERSP